MNTCFEDFRNPFSDGKIVGVNVSYKDYHGKEIPRGNPELVMTQSELFDLVECPLKWKLGGGPVNETPAIRWGDMIDCLTLVPIAFGDRFIFPPKKYCNSKGVEVDWTRHSSTCRDWEDEKEASGVRMLDEDTFNQSRKAVAALRADKEIANLIDHSDHQVHVTAVYHDEDTKLDVPVKGLIDIVPHDMAIYHNCLADLKCPSSASQGFWRRQVFTMGYYVQSVFYLWLWNATGQPARNSFLHILSENTPPYIPAKRCMTDEFLVKGAEFVLAALNQYCRCLKTGVWPDYDYGQDGWRGWSFCSPEPWMMMAGPQFVPINGISPDESTKPESELPT